jgi:hypothetical protein
MTIVCIMFVVGCTILKVLKFGGTMFSCIGDVLVSTSTKHWTCKILQSNENPFQVVAFNSLVELGPCYFQISHSLLLFGGVMEANKSYDGRGIWLG